MYLSFSENSFVLSLLYYDNYLIIKEFSFDKDTYFEYDSNNDILMFGNRKDYFQTLGFKCNMLDFLNFYQIYLQKEFKFKNKSNTF